MATKIVPLIGPTKNTPFRKLMYNLSGFRRYGLMLNDCYSEWCVPEMEEALRRLPPDVLQARDRRIAVAFHLSMNHEILPKEKWTKYEEDVKYLDPYLAQVRKEVHEKNQFKWNNYETK